MLPVAPPIEPEILPLGQEGVLVRFSLAPSSVATGTVQAFFARLRSESFPGVVEIAPSLTSILIRFDPGGTTRRAVAELVVELLREKDWSAVRPPAPRRRWHVPVAFAGDHGPQLAEAAEVAGISETRAIAEIEEADLRVLAIGFAPGQPYLGLLPEHWNIPRQSHLTPRVPAGALVVAVRQLVLFSAPSATGWRQIGQTAFRPFQPAADDPFPLKPGDTLRFQRVSTADMSGLMSDAANFLGGARCEVLA